MSKVTIHMVSSLDGFISKKDKSFSWLNSSDIYEEGATLSEQEIEEYIKGIDCYVMGANTYNQALELGWPYGEVPITVVTHKSLKSDRNNVKFFSGDLDKLVNDHLKSSFKNIWLVGGAMLTKDFIRMKLADEIIVSIMPIILGDGILFFDYVGQEQTLHLMDVTAYKDGMVELKYKIKKG